MSFDVWLPVNFRSLQQVFILTVRVNFSLVAVKLVHDFTSVRKIEVCRIALCFPMYFFFHFQF